MKCRNGIQFNIFKVSNLIYKLYEILCSSSSKENNSLFSLWVEYLHLLTLLRWIKCKLSSTDHTLCAYLVKFMFFYFQSIIHYISNFALFLQMSVHHYIAWVEIFLIYRKKYLQPKEFCICGLKCSLCICNRNFIFNREFIHGLAKPRKLGKLLSYEKYFFHI